MAPLRSLPPPGASQGFSLVEMLVASVILVIAGIGSVGLFTISSRQAALSRSIEEGQFAISIDLANVLRMNDRYVCTATGCAISTSSTLPGENGYYPADSSDQALFLAKCVDGSLSQGLVSLINNMGTTAQMQAQKMERKAEQDTTSSAAHRYSVSWRVNGALIRQITLTPTTAAWCP
ncbi:MAG: PilW family protein [Cyanobacteriota bacterium]|jgi:prepilin-type N-terminal cleavage/methylation domain-containing protein